MNLLRFFRKPTKTEVQIIQRDPLRLTMAEWKSNPELCKKAALALQDPVVRQMLDVLRTNHIGQWAFPLNAGMEMRSLFAEKATGYTLCLNDFENLAVYTEPQDHIESTYGVEE